MKVEIGTNYRHTKTGGTYFVIHNEVLIKMENNWVPGVIYENAKGEVFVRTAKNFEESFEVVK